MKKSLTGQTGQDADLIAGNVGSGSSESSNEALFAPREKKKSLRVKSLKASGGSSSIRNLALSQFFSSIFHLY